MTKVCFDWIFPDPVPEAIHSDLDSFSVPFRSILYRRGCNTSQDAISFLLPQHPCFPENLALGHLDLASSLIKYAIDKSQTIAVYGDYDADGITATALLTQALSKLATRVIPYIPNRLDDGYGLNNTAIEHLHDQGVKLLITVDNGISSIAETAYAKTLGMSVILTDHHQPPQDLPEADAIINPKLPGDPYPNKNLAGVGVAFKLVTRLADHFPIIDPTDYLDLVALGTVADIVPLSGENRYLVKQGLSHINQHRRQSLLSLIGAAGLLARKISATDISFQLAPRLNSSGRLAEENYLAPLELLLSTDPAISGELAQMLEIDNDRRKQLSRALQADIEDQLPSPDLLPPILISFDPHHHFGVAGIAAGYLTRKYHLPAIVGTVSESTTTASCRSIPEFDMVDALDSMEELFTRHGGHKLAAGFTIKNEDLPDFQERMTQLAENKLSSLEIKPQLEIDAIVTMRDLNRSLYQELEKLEPTGAGNPTPVFVLRQVKARQISRVGKHGDHLKFVVDGGKSAIPAIAFGLGPAKKSLQGRIDLAFHFTENEFRGRKDFQLQVVDIKPSD